MTTSTPPAWHWLHECYVPVETPKTPDSATFSKQNGGEALSADSCSLSDSATLGVQNDSDQCPECRGLGALLEQEHHVQPTFGIWATETPICPVCHGTGQSHNPECDVSCSPDISCDRKDDAPGCDDAAKVTDSVSNSEAGAPDECPAPIYQGCHPSWVCNDCGQDRYGKPNGMSTWHYDYCRFCGEFVPCTEPRDFGNRHDSGQFPGQKTGSEEETHEDLQGKDADSFVVTSCPECDSVTDIDYGTVKDKPPDCQAYGKRELAALMEEGYREMAGDYCDPEPARSAIGAGPLFAAICDEVRVPDEWHETGNPLHAHMRATFDSCLAISVAKNAGYAGDADPLANFKTAESLGVPVPLGIAVRMSDKWARLTRLLKTGENPLPSESITDTLQDLINYAAILLYALEDEG